MKSRLTQSILALTFLFFTLTLLWPIGQSRQKSLEEHLEYLASDKVKGRGNGTPEARAVARYLAEYFERLGLESLSNQDLLTPFSVEVGHYLTGKTHVVLRNGSEEWTLRQRLDFDPVALGSRQTIRGTLVFAGYGIHAPELGYSDYQGIDVRDRIVVVFDHEPQERLETSIFSGRDLTPYASELYKILTARNRGAAGVILLPDQHHHPDRRMAGKRKPARQLPDLGLAAIRLKSQHTDRLFEWWGRDRREIADWIDRNLSPRSLSSPELEAMIHMDVFREQLILENVVAQVPGASDTAIVIGAHYDHLGTGGPASLAPEQIGEIHNGADDNASGTAALLELASRLSRRSLTHNLVFAAFAGEEMGLLGSHKFVEMFPVEKIAVMINMDMIGRSDGELLVGGVGTAGEFESILNEVQKDNPLNFKYAFTPSGSSDHVPFYRANIPVLFFFTGLHLDYHRPSDDLNLINLNGLESVVDAVESVILRLDQLAEPPTFVYMGDPFPLHESTEDTPVLGILVDTDFEGDGVRVEAVLENSPAARYGIEPGDILIHLERKPVAGSHDLRRYLKEHRKGDVVQIAWLRGGHLIRRAVELTPNGPP